MKHALLKDVLLGNSEVSCLRGAGVNRFQDDIVTVPNGLSRNNARTIPILWCVAGVTLSMKNMFGVVPGTRYGWPKNILHWAGIQQSILDFCATVPIHFVIADGIIAMEGNGPLDGTPRQLGEIVLSDDPVAADATCARLMGFEPNRVAYIREASRFLGNFAPALIDQVAEAPMRPQTPFAMVPDWAYLQILGAHDSAGN